MPQCPSCGEDNPDRARFCLNCATSLVTAAPASQAEERKVVTVLFCDLVGFTAASEGADPEDVRARVRPYHARLRQEIEGYGGTVEKFIGDAVMAVWGAPVAHEDDPERAVRAGLRILEAIQDMNEADPGLNLSVRIGVNSGEALVALGARPEVGEGMVTGDVVNTASRLQGAAPVGAVVVGERTYRATKAIFDYEELGAVGVKGKARPVPLWRAVAARARFGVDVTRTHETPLVGRDLEVRLLTGTFERGVRESSVQLVTIVGEPGVGKSRLVAELFAHIDALPDLITWRQGRCLPYGEGITFWALGEIVKAHAGILETDDAEAAQAKIDRVVPESHPDVTWLRQRLRPLVGLEAPEAAREENFAAWRAFLEAIAEAGPAVFVFEDLHWGDEALLSFVEYVVEYGEGLPMLLVGTARPELFEKAPGFAQGARNSTRIDLSPLSEAETGLLIAHLLESTVLPAEVQSAILARAGGNPLYSEEFVHLLKDRDILTKQGSRWVLDAQAEIPMPPGIHGLIAARLDTLEQETKQLLADASVVGKVFWAGAVAAMGNREPKQVAVALHKLTRKELVRAARASSMGAQAEYSFSHALIRDVCYSNIPRSSRADRHLRAAAWIEDLASERVEDLAEILAAHYSTALELTRASGSSDTDKISSSALRYLTLAGDRAMGIDVEAAERHYAQALELTTKDDPHRPDLLARSGEALRQRARLPEAARAFEEAIEGLRARGDVRAMAVAMGRYTLVLHLLGDPRHRQLTAEAVAALEPLGPSPELAQALTEQAGASFVSNEDRQTIAFADRAIALAEELGLPEPARALGFRGGARANLGDAGGLQDMRRALDAAADQGLGREVALLHNNLAETLGPIEGPRARLEACQEGAAFAERRGIEEFVLGFATVTVSTLVDLGSYEKAMAMARELVPRLEAAEDVWELLQVRPHQVRVLTRWGEHAEAAPLAHWAVEKAREQAEPQLLAVAFPPAAALRLALGEATDALALLAELERIPNVRGSPYYGSNLPDAVRTALAAGDPELAARLAEGVEPIYSLHEHALATAGALLLEHQGSHAEAAELFADAAERWERFEVPWERAQAHLGWGRCLLELGRTMEATAILQDAREIFASLGAGPTTLARTDALLERATALSS
jgi:class 3 adenylate cyclase/tetratricopeptide (TPR) repeat protein